MSYLPYNAYPTYMTLPCISPIYCIYCLLLCIHVIFYIFYTHDKYYIHTTYYVGISNILSWCRKKKIKSTPRQQRTSNVSHYVSDLLMEVFEELRGWRFTASGIWQKQAWPRAKWQTGQTLHQEKRGEREVHNIIWLLTFESIRGPYWGFGVSENLIASRLEPEYMG